MFRYLNAKHYLFLGFILALNLLQAYFTGLHTDEGYYWYYSRDLSWGYFDHPPMIALLIRLGDLITHSQLGIRLITIIMSLASALIIMKEIDEREDVWFLSLFILSFPLFHTQIGGFLALPDVPLVFFTLLFFLAYRKFLDKQDGINSLWLALTAAAMIYSKYHAFLIIGLTLLSNLRLLKSRYLHRSALIVLILLTPHLIWQFTNGFPSFVYHLHGRAKPFQLTYVFNNIISQLLVLGPLTFFIVIWAMSRFRINKSAFNRALIFNIAGFYIFLFIMSFRNRIEAHWTVGITPLIMFISYPFIAGNAKARLWFRRLALPAVIISLAFRFYMAADFLPPVGIVKSAFYEREERSLEIQEMARGRQVASEGNFSFPGRYEFYTGDKALHLAIPAYRHCQYDMKQDEHQYDGKTLFVIRPSRKTEKRTGKFRWNRESEIDTLHIADFQSLKGVELTAGAPEIKAPLLQIPVSLDNRCGKTISFTHESKPMIGVMQGKKEIFAVPLSNYASKIAASDKLSIVFNIPIEALEPDQPLVLYTRTKYNHRGEMTMLRHIPPRL